MNIINKNQGYVLSRDIVNGKHMSKSYVTIAFGSCDICGKNLNDIKSVRTMGRGNMYISLECAECFEERMNEDDTYTTIKD